MDRGVLTVWGQVPDQHGTGRTDLGRRAQVLEMMAHVYYESSKRAAQQALTDAYEAYQRAVHVLGFDDPETEAAKRNLEAVEVQVESLRQAAIESLLKRLG